MQWDAQVRDDGNEAAFSSLFISAFRKSWTRKGVNNTPKCQNIKFLTIFLIAVLCENWFGEVSHWTNATVCGYFESTFFLSEVTFCRGSTTVPSAAFFLLHGGRKNILKVLSCSVASEYSLNAHYTVWAKNWQDLLSHARDQWYPTNKLRICEIWAKIPRQNHFKIRTLIFPSMQSSSDSVHHNQLTKLTKFDPWSPAITPHACDFWGSRNTLVMVFGLETPSTCGLGSFLGQRPSLGKKLWPAKDGQFKWEMH
jgi:hypothetical protein